MPPLPRFLNGSNIEILAKALTCVILFISDFIPLPPRNDDPTTVPHIIKRDKKTKFTVVDVADDVSFGSKD